MNSGLESKVIHAKAEGMAWEKEKRGVKGKG
jgi:hypothetical protein